MDKQTSIYLWAFPFCPTPPDWTIDWPAAVRQFSWLQALEDVPQDPVYHAEGNVLIHTRMVAEALVALEEWRVLGVGEQSALFAAALLHDIAKAQSTREENGRITSRGHALKGEKMARRILWTGHELDIPAPFEQREYIVKLVRFHGLPLQFLDKASPERVVIEASQSVRLDHVALLAEADVRGRKCVDQQELLERIALFREFCQEQACYTTARAFPDHYSRFVYFHSEQGDPNYQAYDATTFEVLLLSGLPGAGKDTWVRNHAQSYPVISLDGIRKEMKVSATDEQGRVVQAARERARELLRKKQTFVWNATNVTKMMRQQLVELFVSYGARVRIVYIDAPFSEIISRNRARQESLPEHVIYKLLDKLEVPAPTEGHEVAFEGVLPAAAREGRGC